MNTVLGNYFICLQHMYVTAQLLRCICWDNLIYHFYQNLQRDLCMNALSLTASLDNISPEETPILN